MTIFLDSAIISEAQAVAQFGWVGGITTNPVLLAKSDLAPEETLRKLAFLTSGPVFYQLTATTVTTMISEAERAKDILGSQLVLKIPPTAAGFTATTELSSSIPCCITALYAPSQVMVAEAAGARYAIVYYHRLLETLPTDGKRLLGEMIAVLKNSQTELVAASIKSSEEAVAARCAGIPHLTLPFAVLTALMTNDLSDQAINNFNQNGRGLASQ